MDFNDTETALHCFDHLDPVNLEFMLGSWRGFEVTTGHPLEGLLPLVGWHGKRFDSVEEVHPLVMKDGQGRYSLNPLLISMSMLVRLPRLPVLRTLTRALKPILRTERSQARLRMTEFRGQISATMCYDSKPIHDIFRRLDSESVLGLMDMKGWAQPYFFRLERES